MASPEASLESIMQAVPQGAESVFPKAEYQQRIDRLRGRMKEKDFDLVLLSGPENIFYLTGQQTPGYYTFQSLCIPASGEPFHVLRGLEAMNARLNTFLTDITGYADDEHPAAAVAAVLKKRGWNGKRVGIDQNGWFLTVNLYNRLVAEFGPMLDATGLVEPLRRVKSKLEIEQMENAGRANDEGMQAGLAVTRAGASENDIASAIMAASIKAGGEYVGMEPFVTSGPRSGIPHTTWRRRRLEPGDVAVLETCGLLQSLSRGACSARSRSAKFRSLRADMYKVCAEGLGVAIETASARQYLRRCAQRRPGRHRQGRLHGGLSQAHRLQHGYFICAGLGRGQYPEPVPRHRRSARARNGLPCSDHAARVQ